MATVKDHYQTVLSDVYSWMFGGFEAACCKSLDFFERFNLQQVSSGIAVDLGAGCGFYSIPLSQAGYNVTAIDISAELLAELNDKKGCSNIKTIEGDLVDFDKYLDGKPELVICMTDTILHLDSREKVLLLFNKVFDSLERNGKFVLTFRDLTWELKELDRFIPVKSDDNRILSCFLEYEEEIVKVYDIMYEKSDDGWKLSKSFYRKLRLSVNWVKEHLNAVGFSDVDVTVESGLATIIAEK